MFFNKKWTWKYSSIYYYYFGIPIVFIIYQQIKLVFVFIGEPGLAGSPGLVGIEGPEGPKVNIYDTF